jgi:hypothetical protein
MENILTSLHLRSDRFHLARGTFFSSCIRRKPGARRKINRERAEAEAEREALIASAHREAGEIRRRAHEQVERLVRRSRGE